MLIPKKLKLSVKLEFLKERIEQLVSDINMKRKRDSEMLEGMYYCTKLRTCKLRSLCCVLNTMEHECE